MILNCAFCGKELPLKVPLIHGHWTGPFKGRACSLDHAKKAAEAQKIANKLLKELKGNK